MTLGFECVFLGVRPCQHSTPMLGEPLGPDGKPTPTTRRLPLEPGTHTGKSLRTLLSHPKLLATTQLEALKFENASDTYEGKEERRHHKSKTDKIMDKLPPHEDGARKLREILVKVRGSNDAMDCRVILLGVEYWPDVLKVLCPGHKRVQDGVGDTFLRFRFSDKDKGVMVGVFRHPRDWWDHPETKTPAAAYSHLQRTAQLMERLVNAKPFEESGKDRKFYSFASANTAISSAATAALAVAA